MALDVISALRYLSEGVFGKRFVGLRLRSPYWSRTLRQDCQYFRQSDLIEVTQFYYQRVAEEADVL